MCTPSSMFSFGSPQKLAERGLGDHDRSSVGSFKEGAARSSPEPSPPGSPSDSETEDIDMADANSSLRSLVLDNPTQFFQTE
eukprot:m.404175 g.404175  ORF g.404175 m.404175 type:complete len:82 (+) comp56474_c0_seq8:715-960(+)